MFGLFSPTCPVPPEEKAWLETNMKWLHGQFGRAPLMKPVVLPTTEFFPDSYNGTYEEIRALLDRVCGYMDVDPARVDLDFHTSIANVPLAGSQVEGQAAGGLYLGATRPVVSIDETRCGNPLILVSIMAHELAHAHLLGEKRISNEHPDHEPLTDLAVIYFGMGVFLANSSLVYEQSHDFHWSRWRVSRSGYLSERKIAYALALYAWMRQEHKPAWARHLRLNVRSPFKEGLRYLVKTRDTTL